MTPKNNEQTRNAKFCSKLLKNCRKLIAKRKEKRSLGWKARCQRFRKQCKNSIGSLSFWTVKSKYTIAVYLQALTKAYQYDPEVYLYSLLIMQNLSLATYQSEASQLCQYASAVFIFASLVFGCQCRKVLTDEMLQQFPIANKEGIQKCYRQVVIEASGISILDVIREENKNEVIAEMEQAIKSKLEVETARIIKNSQDQSDSTQSSSIAYSFIWKIQV